MNMALASITNLMVVTAAMNSNHRMRRDFRDSAIRTRRVGKLPGESSQVRTPGCG